MDSLNGIKGRLIGLDVSRLLLAIAGVWLFSSLSS
jgi:hypothetical protein